MRRVGVLMNIAEDDPQAQGRMAAFLQGLQPLGWIVGRNLQIDARWARADADLFHRHATELVALRPEVILASSSSAVAPLRQATRTIPIVFVLAIDPVAAGDVASLARPSGNATGFLLYEYSISGKWLELLKQIAPRVTRVAVLRDPTIPTGPAQFSTIQALAPSLGVQVNPVNARNANEVENRIATFARTPNGGLIVTGTPSVIYRHLIIKLAAQYNLPSIYETLTA